MKRSIIVADRFDGIISKHDATNQNPDTLARELLDDWREGTDKIIKRTTDFRILPSWHVITDLGDLDIFAYQIEEE